jgi:hypothetical protein
VSRPVASLIPDYDRQLKQRINAGYVGWACKTYGDLFEWELEMCQSTDRHLKVNTYSFAMPVNGGDGE